MVLTDDSTLSQYHLSETLHKAATYVRKSRRVSRLLFLCHGRSGEERSRQDGNGLDRKGEARQEWSGDEGTGQEGIGE